MIEKVLHRCYIDEKNINKHIDKKPHIVFTVPVLSPGAIENSSELFILFHGETFTSTYI